MNIHVPGQGAKVEERQRCDKFFAAYRECRKAEHSRILEARGQGR